MKLRRFLNQVNDAALKQFIDFSSTRPKIDKKFTVLLMLFFSLGAFAQDVSAVDNVVTRFVWFIAQVAFYGCGAAVVLMGILIPIAKKVLGQRTETNPVVNILWAIGLFSAPSLLKLGVNWFSSDESSEGLLEDMNVDFGL